jgi:tRNA(adenine34) deaminase
MNLDDYRPRLDFMEMAIEAALASRQLGDYAIGALVEKDGVIIATSGNRIKLDCDPTQHAEIAAIRNACQVVGSRHIPGAVLYTTAEPCPMCSSAAVWARMAGVVSGSTIDDMADFRNAYGGPEWSWRTIDLAARSVLASGEPKLFLIEGVLREQCRELFHAQ